MRRGKNRKPDKKNFSGFWGLSAGTVITKETKEPNNRVLLGALLFGCIVSFVLRNLCLGTYRRNRLLTECRHSITEGQCSVAVHMFFISFSSFYLFLQTLAHNNTELDIS